MNLNEHFYYGDGKLFAKYDRTNNLCKKGDRVGFECSTGYRRIIVNGKKEQEHRVIWRLKNGPIPEGCTVDHINRDPRDNRIDNLRLVTPSQSCMNRTTPANNKSGKTGVGFRSREQKWVARINVNGRRKQLGCFDSFEKAVKARLKAEHKYYGEYAPS